MGKLPFLADIPASEYHEAARQGRFLSSHLLGDFRKSPRLYRKKMTGEIEPEDSAAFLMGRAVHTLILRNGAGSTRSSWSRTGRSIRKRVRRSAV